MAIDIGCNRPRPVPPTPRPERGCICKTVERIDQIQKLAILEDSTLGCSAPDLGDNVRNRRIFNTRPFSLYLPNGERLSIIVDDGPFNDTSAQPQIDLDNLNIEIDNLENTTTNTPSNNVRGSTTNRVTNINASTNIRPTTTRVNSTFHTPNRANVFRVENVDGCCAVLRALLPRRGSSRNGFIATCVFCTVDLNDFVCVQCFDDTFVNLGRCFDL